MLCNRLQRVTSDPHVHWIWRGCHNSAQSKCSILRPLACFPPAQVHVLAPKKVARRRLDPAGVCLNRTMNGANCSRLSLLAYEVSIKWESIRLQWLYPNWYTLRTLFRTKQSYYKVCHCHQTHITSEVGHCLGAFGVPCRGSEDPQAILVVSGSACRPATTTGTQLSWPVCSGWWTKWKLGSTPTGSVSVTVFRPKLHRAMMKVTKQLPFIHVILSLWFED
jgi:hypothetical protein